MPNNKHLSYIIGIDIGTGSAKAIAMTSDGIIIADSQFFYPTQNSQPGYSEQNPEAIWDAFVNCIKKIIDNLKYPPVSISLSSAMHSLVVLNKKNLPITPLITWADTRSVNIAERIRNLPEAENIYKATGTPIHSMSPLCKIIWLRENKPRIFKDAFKFISIKEFIWYQLFEKYEIDFSIASATGLFNIKRCNWNQASLYLCGIHYSQLSELFPTDFIRRDLSPVIATLLSVPANTSFCIGASDGCLANLGSYAIKKGTAALTIGTSGAVRLASPKPILNFRGMTFNYLLDKKTFICGGPVNNGGNILKWLFQAFLNNINPSKKDYENLFNAISKVPAGSKGLIFLPYLHGERSPVWDEKSSGIFFGIKPFHTNAFFLRAALEGICYSMCQVLEIVESSTTKIQQLNVGGGFIHSKVWLKMLADITGNKLCVIETEDSSAIGAVLLNMKALKMIKNYSALKPLKNVVISPDIRNHKVYKRYFAVFLNLYESMKDSMHEVYGINLKQG
ncbi:MAG: gluconokinase [Ginsengibacter sp.]